MKRTTLIILALTLILAGMSVGIVNAEVYIWMDGDAIRHISNVKPNWWTDEMDKLDPGTVIAPDEENGLLGKFIGDRENKKFHWPKCIQILSSEGFLAIPETKRIWFQKYQDVLLIIEGLCFSCQPTNLVAQHVEYH